MWKLNILVYVLLLLVGMTSVYSLSEANKKNLEIIEALTLRVDCIEREYEDC